MKTRPAGKDFIKMDSTGSRKLFIADLDIGPGLEPPRIVPGTFTVELKAGGATYKQTLEVLKDPNAHSTMEDIKAQYALGTQLYKYINSCMSLIEAMEIKRVALQKENTSASMEQEKKIFALESLIFDAKQTGSRWDGFRNPSQLLENLLALAKESQTYGADYKPTTQQLETFKLFSKQFDKIKKEYQSL